MTLIYFTNIPKPYCLVDLAALLRPTTHLAPGNPRVCMLLVTFTTIFSAMNSKPAKSNLSPSSISYSDSSRSISLSL